MAQDPFSQDAWTRARDRFVEDLTEAEKGLFYQSSLEMILYDASAAQKHHEDASTSRNLMTKLQPLTSAIEQYGEALDVYANAFPLALSPLWGSLRIVLQLAREFGKYFEKLVDMFERIGDLLPRFRAYERLFPNNERLVQSLSVVYVDVVVFCSDVKHVFRRGERSAIKNLKIFSKLIWKPFDAHYAGSIRNFREHKKNVEKEVELSHMIESADSRAVILANLMQLEKQKQEDERQRMLSRLSAISHEHLHRKQRRSCHKGTGLWALSNAAYVTWRSEIGSGGLCYYGIPGCGKSVLASTIVEDLLGKEKELNITVVYYYCSHADARSLQTTQILGNLLRQLITKGSISKAAERELGTLLLRERQGDEEAELAKIMHLAVEQKPGVCIVIDGLDECKDDARKSILTLLTGLVSPRNTRTRVMLTCREEGQIIKSFHQWPQVQMSEAALVDDIRLYVTSSVRARVETGDLRTSDSSLEEEIVEALVKKAHGMFLWVHFQLVELCAAASDAQVREVLNDLPDGLGETYGRILARIGESSARTRTANRVFLWLNCARRPFHMKEMQEAIAFDESDKAWNPNKIPDIDRLMQACQGLVIRDHEDGVVRFAHYTVQQYLLSTHLDRFRSDTREAERVIVALCVAYLNFEDFQTAIVPRAPDLRFNASGILGSSGPGTIPSTLGLGKPVLDVIYRVMGARARTDALDVDFAQYLNVRPRVVNAGTSEKYALLGYIIENWAWHVENIHHKDRVKLYDSDKLASLVENKKLPFEFRPWGPNRHLGRYGCNQCWTTEDATFPPRDLPLTSMMHWAAEYGAVSMLKLMYWIGSDVLRSHLRHERYSNETLLIACRYGRVDVIHYLNDYLPTEESSLMNLLMATCSSGHTDTLQAILEYIEAKTKDFEVLIQRSENCDALLYTAATNGHTTVVRFLLHRNSRGRYGFYTAERNELTGLTPLHAATIGGHAEIVKSLAATYSYVDTRDRDSGSTALHYAVKIGNLQIISALRWNGASVSFPNNQGETPWQLSVGSPEVRKELKFLYQALPTELEPAVQAFNGLDRRLNGF